jgi:hypothetical protein
VPWGVIVASMMNTYGPMKPGKLYYPEKEHECGWKCTGCKATNAPEVNQCIWCRSYKLTEAVPITQSTNSPLAFDMYTSQVASSRAWMEATKITPKEEP